METLNRIFDSIVEIDMEIGKELENNLNELRAICGLVKDFLGTFKDAEICFNLIDGYVIFQDENLSNLDYITKSRLEFIKNSLEANLLSYRQYKDEVLAKIKA